MARAVHPILLGGLEASRLRRPAVRDVFRRLAVVPPDKLTLVGYPSRRVAAVFNPGLALEAGRLVFMPRIVAGYYTYTSMIGETRLDVGEVFERGPLPVTVEPAILPDSPWDAWGAEDPRAYWFRDALHVTYTGRTPGYRSGVGPKALPVTAARRKQGWVKEAVHYPLGFLGLKYDKDAFLVDARGRVYFFHRPVTDDYYLAVGLLGGPPRGRSVPLREWIAIPRAGFESRIGWGTPPIDLGGGRLLFILHGVDSEGVAYRAFAAVIRVENRGLVVEAVTREYIMAPSTVYEVFGDRPHTVFPTGAAVIDGDTLLVAYGAADYFAAFAEASLSEVEEALDRGATGY